MPLEIRELVIKATVNNSSSGQSGAQQSKGSADVDINEIVEKVFKIIKDKSER
ncbi:DUF5908 family protein [Leptobacterium flavescens]|uniref:DUF5908 family protein n=1 Tax=Leptobacterium flavescens TaxID=472055 RepID=UPI0019539ECD|nr:DUF5908 family protein [Leptobacterium flavescens]